jgi:hypothetical protein
LSIYLISDCHFFERRFKDPDPPRSLEQLLERQWTQTAQFLMDQPQHFDISSLLSCLHQLRTDNQKLEERLRQLLARRDHLIAVNARLSIPLNGLGVMHPTQNPNYSLAVNASNLSQLVSGHSSSSTSPAGNSNFYSLSAAQHLQQNGIQANSMNKHGVTTNGSGSFHELVTNPSNADKGTPPVNGSYGSSTNGNSIPSTLSQYTVGAQPPISYPSTSGMTNAVPVHSNNSLQANVPSLPNASLFQSLMSQQSQQFSVNPTQPTSQRSNSKR